MSSDISVADTFVPTPTNARVNASFDPAKIIFFFTVAESGALTRSRDARSNKIKGHATPLRTHTGDDNGRGARTYHEMNTNLLAGLPSVVVKSMSYSAYLQSSAGRAATAYKGGDQMRKGETGRDAFTYGGR